MRYFSLFSGVGGFELAINNVYDKNSRLARERECNSGSSGGQETLDSLGMGDSQTNRNTDDTSNGPQATCVGYSEIDKYAVSVYQYHYPKHKNYGDITQIDWNTVPDFDLVVGGSPCQDLSVAGKQKGLSGARSGLFFEFVRCLKEKQPTNFIWENVKGALSSSNGWDFARVQIEFSEVGYDVEWQVLNAKDFGVPQNRERIFAVGHLRGKSEPKVFPIFTSTVKADGKSNRNFIDLSTLNPKQTDVARTIQSRYAKGYSHHAGEVSGVIHQINQPTHSNDRVYSDDGISPSLNTMQGGRRQPKVIRTPLKFLQRNQKNIEGDYAFTVDSANTGGVKVDTKIRRLTPLECERLMSWPDLHTKFGIVTDKIICYNNSGNELICNQAKIKKLASWKIVRENGKPISVIVSCTTSDGKDTEAQRKLTEKNEDENTVLVYVDIVMKKLENMEPWECVADITRWQDSTEIRYILKRNVKNQVGMATSEKEMGLIPIDESWKTISADDLNLTKLSTTLTAISSITESLISTFAHAKNIRLSIKSLPNLSTKESKWEILSLETDTIEVMSDSSRYKMCGNGVVSKVVEAIIERLYPLHQVN